jgi:N-hydroxyarylamine O-acetyltransferase
MTVFDLDAYLARVSFTGERAPTLETLSELQRSVPRAIPFENLDVLLERPISLELGAITQKLVHEHRGGYCFEQNLLFGAALRALGYQVVELAARVQGDDDDETCVSPRTHMLLSVEVAGQPYFCDVGFGAPQQTAPLRAELELEQQTPHEPFCVRSLPAGDLQIQAKLKGSWDALYRFDLTRQHLVDYELANYWVSTNPNSFFVKNLVVARADEGRRYALLNNAFSVHELGGQTERRLISDAVELRDLLQRTFHIRLPMAPTLEPLLERLVRLRPSLAPATIGVAR